MRSPIIWYGGKHAQSQWILQYVTSVKHKVYVEPFAGGASVFFHKKPSGTEVLNDINHGLYEFFKVLADTEMFARFRRMVEALPYSRKMFHEFKESQFTETDMVKRAAGWFYVTRQSLSGGRKNWGYNRTSSKRQVSAWKNIIDRLPEIHDRLLDAQIESLDACDCIVRYDSPEALFYCDPPYVMDTRNDKSQKYEHEMTAKQHERLMETLLAIQGKAILSGYEHAVYRPLLENGWVIRKKQFHCNAAGRVRGSGLQGSGSAGRQTRTECLYLSPGIVKENLLF